MRKFASICLALVILAAAGINAQDVPTSIGPAPVQDYRNVPNTGNDLAVGSRCWLYLSSSPTFQFQKAFLESCTATNIGSPFTVTFPGGLVNKGGTIYTWNQSSPYQIYSIDTVTGVHTLLINATGVVLTNWTGMTWDGTTMYGVGTSLSASQIFTVNMTTGVCTPIGAPSATCAGAIFLSGMPSTSSLFSADIVLDNLYKWNKTTGVATIVGPLGGNANFGQDAQFDQADGKLYWASYITGPALRTIDTTTGGGVQLCTYTAQMTGIAMNEAGPALAPLCEQFASATFPPTGWTEIFSGTNYWARVTQSGFNLGVGSARWDCWNAPNGTRQTLITLNTTPVSFGAFIFLDVAYQPFGTSPDSLIIAASTNGGTTYTSVARLSYLQLGTTTGQPSPFVPTLASHWKRLSYAIPNGTNKMIFEGYSGFGDNLYIDSLCTGYPVGINTNNNEIPKVYSLNQNYPNPFNPSTQISFGLPKSGNVKLVVFDILGREVKTLVNEFQTAGTHNITFDGSALASGIYFYTITANEFTATKKMLLVK